MNLDTYVIVLNKPGIRMNAYWSFRSLLYKLKTDLKYLAIETKKIFVMWFLKKQNLISRDEISINYILTFLFYLHLSYFPKLYYYISFPRFYYLNYPVADLITNLLYNLSVSFIYVFKIGKIIWMVKGNSFSGCSFLLNCEI